MVCYSTRACYWHVQYLKFNEILKFISRHSHISKAPEPRVLRGSVTLTVQGASHAPWCREQSREPHMLRDSMSSAGSLTCSVTPWAVQGASRTPWLREQCREPHVLCESVSRAGSLTCFVSLWAVQGTLCAPWLCDSVGSLMCSVTVWGTCQVALC